MQNLTWTTIEPDWTIEQVRLASTKLICTYKLAMWEVLRKHPQIMKEVQDAIMQSLVNDIHALGINTPIAFVKYLAELTVNLGGGKISISGNEKEATISYDEIPSWELMREKFLSDQDAKEEMIVLFKEAVERLSVKLGFSCHIEATLNRPIATMMFKVPIGKTF